ncbi:MBL fold metallo-hydrolase [Microbacterium sp. ASV49]|uniref:MBL fold metallo-hydrolase n=1 Tax=Microbacterium candidum TaxID=3041922 RepID=A0ABT7MY12_9MICO|nr:MBL fold metallo-hydrolase [Microbacterium sp. ASV49]MDL9979344.1 MBL fold metallo-hydrolase [Microbacterium sp. ASV49]
MTRASSARPTSMAQRDAWDARGLPAPEHVSDGLWAFPVPIPASALPYTLAYVFIGSDGVHVVDPGWDGVETLPSIEKVLASFGLRVTDIVTIIVTHHHPDHLGAAARLRQASGARLVLSGREADVLTQETAPGRNDRAAYERLLEAWAVPSARREELRESFDRPSLVPTTVADVLVADGDRIELGDAGSLDVLLTPGHTSGHMCLVDRARGVVLSGDHVLPRIYAGVGIGTLPGTDPLGDYLDSLDRIAGLGDLEVLPGHEFRFTGLAGRCAEIAAHHLRRTAEVAVLRPELGDAPVWEYARRLTWTAGWDGLDGFHLHSALRQADMHLDLVRSGRAAAFLSRVSSD